MSVEEIRKYKNLLESVLMEAQNYDEMFTEIVNLKPEQFVRVNTKNEISNIIGATKRALRKSNRIVWFLRQWRIGFVSAILNMYRTALGADQDVQYILKPYENLLVKYLKDYQARADLKNLNTAQFKQIYDYPSDFLTQFQHFFSLPIPEIQNFKFAFQNVYAVRNHFAELERKWKEKAADMIPYDPTDGKVIMTFPDGFFWQNLNREYCNKEGDAMGHCGNAASYQSGDQVLSLRKKVKVGKDTYVRPSLTFILHHNGFLGEMKGRGNEKPNAKYHPHIVALLKLPMIKGISGGGYAPEHNFKITDLDKATQTELISEKPALLSMSEHYKRFGLDSMLLDAITTEFSDLMIPENADYAIVEWYNDIRKMISRYGDSTTIHIMKTLDGTDTSYDAPIPDNPVAALIEKMDYRTIDKIKSFIKKHNPVGVSNWTKQYGHFGPDDIARFLSDSSGDYMVLLYDNLNLAYTIGAESGMKKQMFRYLKNEISNYEHINSVGVNVAILFGNPNIKPLTTELDFDQRVNLVISIKDVIKVISDEWAIEEVKHGRMGNGWLNDFYLSIDEPYNGFDEFDLKAALDFLYDEYPELKEDKE